MHGKVKDPLVADGLYGKLFNQLSHDTTGRDVRDGVAQLYFRMWMAQADSLIIQTIQTINIP